MIETLGEAWNADWHLMARCARGMIDYGRSATKCEWSYNLDMMTLVATRGRDFPVADLAKRLRCPRCGCREIRVIYVMPGDRIPQRGKMAIGKW
jgi:hypothetical protein